METGEQKEKLDKHFRNKEFYFSQRGEDNVYAQTIFKVSENVTICDIRA